MFKDNIISGKGLLKVTYDRLVMDTEPEKMNNDMSDAEFMKNIDISEFAPRIFDLFMTVYCNFSRKTLYRTVTENEHILTYDAYTMLYIPAPHSLDP